MEYTFLQPKITQYFPYLLLLLCFLLFLWHHDIKITKECSTFGLRKK
ncbi:DUF2933 domain-containing protein [Muribaculum intestinale]